MVSRSANASNRTPNGAIFPSFFFLGQEDKNLTARALETGGVDYLSRPFQNSELLSRVRTQLMLKTTRDHLKRLAKDQGGIDGHDLASFAKSPFWNGNERAIAAGSSQVHKSDPKVVLLAENIRSTTSQMHTFIKALLANATADRGFSIKMEPVHFSEAAGRAIARYTDAVRTKELVLNADLPQDRIFYSSRPSGPGPGIRQPSFQCGEVLSTGGGKSPSRWNGSIPTPNAGSRTRARDSTPEDTTRLYHRYARLSARLHRRRAVHRAGD